MSERRTAVAPREWDGERVDRLAVLLFEGVSRSAVVRAIAEGTLTVDGLPTVKSAPVKAGQELALCLPDPVKADALPENIPLNIVFEDEHLLVVEKPKGMVVHPGAGNRDATLVNALLYHCAGALSGIGGVERPGIVHRIDKDTSGLLLVAKDDRTHRGLAAQIQAHSLERCYFAVVCGHLREASGVVDAPIGRHPTQRKKMAVIAGGRPARTHYEVLEELPGYSLLRLRLETGRTHQIRVHMAYLGHPVAGDTVYGSPKGVAGLEGQCLHAAELGFIHPISGEHLHFTAPLPEYFTAFLAAHRREG